jgi:hypothetical protein
MTASAERISGGAGKAPPSNQLPDRPGSASKAQADDARALTFGHEGLLTTTAQPPTSTLEAVGFVRPSDLLRRPRAQSRPMYPLTALDREQFEGLVRTFGPPPL